MRATLVALVLSLLSAAGQVAPDTGAGITQVLAVLSAGGVLTLCVQKWLNRRQDGVGLSERAVKMVRESLEAVEAMREQVEELSRRLSAVQRDLSAANRRIADLERQLETANGDRAELERQLAEALATREDLQEQLEALRTRMAGMEAALSGEEDPGAA